MDTTTVLATKGDQRAYDITRGMLATGAPIEDIAARLFELSADYDGELLDDLVDIVAEATSNPDPSPALRLIAERVGAFQISGTSTTTEVLEEWRAGRGTETITTSAFRPLAHSA